MEATLDNGITQEASRGLNIGDRLLYLALLATLETFLNISKRPSPVLTRETSLRQNRETLVKIVTYLRPLDSDLADVFERASKA